MPWSPDIIRHLCRGTILLVATGALACSSSNASTGTPKDAGHDAARTKDAGHDAASRKDARHDGTPAKDARHDARHDARDAGADGPASLPDADAQAAPPVTVTAFDSTLICFGSGGVGPCSRTVDAPVTFPTTGTYSRILMHVSLDCPSNGCDPWDRMGSIDLVTGANDAGAVETLTELGRFITPFGITSGVNSAPWWDIDVTELRPLLSGTVTLRAFIDTWVPQGNAAAYGGGWVLGASFVMTPGKPAKEPVAVVPIWVWKTTNKEPTQVVYGDPSQPISTSVPTQNLTLPTGATSFGVQSTITGHGQGNLDNCSEFCSQEHTWLVDTTPNNALVWRTDCANYPSSGTYQYSRAGWCPGADVIPWDIDVTNQVGSSGSASVSYSVAPYVNTCNGSYPADGGSCTGCAPGASCAYDGSDHTQPFYYVQGLLIGFR